MGAYSTKYGYNKEIFVHKFGREPREWTIEEVHELWEKACERAQKRYKVIKEFTDEIVNEIPKNSRNRFVIYFTQVSNGKSYLRQYEFSWHSDWRCYGVSINNVDLKTREEKLDFFTAHEKAYEMGQKYHKLKKLETDLHYRVKYILWRMIDNKLQNLYKDKLPEEVFIIQISGKKYYIETDPQHRGYGYKKFNLRGECNDEVIKIGGTNESNEAFIY